MGYRGKLIIAKLLIKEALAIDKDRCLFLGGE